MWRLCRIFNVNIKDWTKKLWFQSKNQQCGGSLVWFILIRKEVRSCCFLTWLILVHGRSNAPFWGIQILLFSKQVYHKVRFIHFTPLLLALLYHNFEWNTEIMKRFRVDKARWLEVFTLFFDIWKFVSLRHA